MKRMAILAMVFFVASVAVATAAEDQELQRAFQSGILFQQALRFNAEYAAILDLTSRLEGFETKDSALQKKISGWLPTLKEYSAALTNAIKTVGKFLDRAEREILSQNEMEAEFTKCLTPELGARVKTVLTEIKNSGLVPLLYPENKD